MLSDNVKTQIAKQEMVVSFEAFHPLFASPYNPNKSERTSNQPGKDLDHVTN